MAALLLDENMPRPAGSILAAAGHDIAWVADLRPGARDQDVLALARGQQRLLVTFDADFGDLVYRQGAQPPPALLFVRMHPIDGSLAGALVVEALGSPCDGQFVVCSPEGLRRRPLPAGSDG